MENLTNQPIVAQENSISTVNVEQALEEWNAYQTITERMLDETDYQKIKGRMYKKKSAWRKYARAFNINTEIIKEDVIKTDKGRVIEATFVVRATLPTGRYADGWGNCSRFEKNRANPNHDIPATAMTRATNRAIADLIGAGEVTADEMSGELYDNSTPRGKPKSKPKPVVPEVIEVETVETVKEPVFETADNITPLDLDPVTENFVKTLIRELHEDGLRVTKNNIVKQSYSHLKKKEITSKDHKDVISWCNDNCPDELETLESEIVMEEGI